MISIELLIVAIGLSIDSFAISVSTGISDQRIQQKDGIRMALVLALIQGIAPVFGALLGTAIKEMLQSADHWIALGLLILVGAKMIFDGFQKHEDTSSPKVLSTSVIVLMGIATSIDAVVVGIGLGIVGVNLLHMGLIVGGVTFIAAGSGVYLGTRFARLSRLRLEILAGLILIAIGINIVREHIMAGI